MRFKRSRRASFPSVLRRHLHAGGLLRGALYMGARAPEQGCKRGMVLWLPEKGGLLGRP